MKRLHFLGFTCVCLGIAAMLLFRANSHAIAASASSCGSWNVVPSPNNGNSVLSGIATIAPNDIWAVGYSSPSNKIYSKTLIEHWDGTSWSIVPSPNVPSTSNGLSGVTAISATDIWAVGSTGKRGISLIEHWNGTTWSLVTGPNPPGGSDLYSVAAVSATDIWAVGPSNKSHALIEHWDGTKWSVVPSALAKGGTLQTVGVVSATNIWAVGYTYSNGVTSTLTEHWNGTTWSIVASPNPGDHANSFNAVASVPGSNYVWAVGTTNYSGATLTAYYC